MDSNSTRNSLIIISTIFSCFFFLHSSSPASLASADTTGTASELIHIACESHNFNSTFCYTVLNSSAEAAQAKNFTALADIGLKMAIAYTTKERDRIHDLARNETNPSLKSHLRNCVDDFDSAIGWFRFALGSVHNVMPGPDIAVYGCYRVTDQTGNCESELKSGGVRADSSVWRSNYNVFQYALVNAELANHI